jgi:hypothetical protein
MQLQQMESLFQKFLDNTCTPEEINTLLEAFGDEIYEPRFRQSISKQLLDNAHYAGHENHKADLEQIFSAIKNNISQTQINPTKASYPMYQKIWYAAAIVCILLLIGGGFFYLQFKNGRLSDKLVQQKSILHDVAPANGNVILTLSDGKKINLGDTTKGVLTQQGQSQLVLIDQKRLAYHQTGNEQTILYNEIQTNRGSTYQITLSDGTKVWLNADSYIKFPTAFSGKDRAVEIKGEVYFEVTHDATKPFMVAVNHLKVEVLGTKFNIMAYGDEPQIKTTLTEGKIWATYEGKTLKLNPGQQAILQHQNNAFLLKDADIDKEIAWVNGLFDFDNDSIEDIMRQLARWYDVKISFERPVSTHYSGSVRRQSNISQVLKMLELAGGVQFQINDKQINIK